MNMIVYIRDYPDGQYMYILILVGAWVTDTFAYFTGFFFGKPDADKTPPEAITLIKSAPAPIHSRVIRSTLVSPSPTQSDKR